jgi:glycosyltransferase involved in cell wall biosynthesis
MSREIQILKVVTGLNYGGAETQLKNVALRLKRRGWEVGVVSMLPPCAYVDELETAGIPVYNLRMRRKVPDPRAIFRLAAVVRCTRPWIVHSYMVHANLLARFTRLIAPIPIVISSARNIIEGGWIREIAYRLTDPLADLTTQVSEEGRKRYIQIGATPPHKIVYIPNGIDTSRFQPNPTVRQAVREILGCPPKAFVWLTVGRLEPVKNHFELLRAFREVTANAAHTWLLIAGQGPLRAALEQRIAELKLTNCVRLLGLRSDIPDLLNAADAFVLTSLWEGMSNALLEAASTALPIVATEVGGNAEIVLDGRTGYLVPPSNIEALSQRMLHVMSLPEDQRNAMGQAGREHILQNFDIERVVDRWETLYRELLQRNGLL